LSRIPLFSGMSRAAPDKPTEEEERSSDEEEEKYELTHSSSPGILEYPYPEIEPDTSLSGHSSLSSFELQQPSGLRTRGPGRPRIHVSIKQS